jgi:microcystin-dependent protein
MVTPYLGEVRPLSFNFAPKGWAQCNGQTLSITQNQALFALLGTTYGGNGTTNFQLPNLQSRVPVHRSTDGTYIQGATGGAEQVTILTGSMPQHNHAFVGTTATASTRVPTGLMATSVVTTNYYYSPPTNQAALNPATISAAGGNQPHSNIQPYLTINYCIALQGVFPSRN